MSPTHQCSECKKMLSRSTTLRAHLRNHTGEKPFGCSLCDKAFNRKWDLEQHQKTHGSARKYVCGRDDPDHAGCSARFHRKTDLARHLANAVSPRRPVQVAPHNHDAQETAPQDHSTHGRTMQDQTLQENSSKAHENDMRVAAAETLTLLRRAPMDPENNSYAVNPGEDELLGCLEEGEMITLNMDVDDEANITEAESSLDGTFLRFFVKTSLFYRLVLDLYRIAHLAMKPQTIETDLDGLEIRAGTLVRLRNSLISAAELTVDVLLGISIVVLTETLFRVGDDRARSIHIKTLRYTLRDAINHGTAFIPRLIRQTSPDFVELCLSLAAIDASCPFDVVSDGEFARKLASTMFHSGLIINIPELVEASVASQRRLRQQTNLLSSNAEKSLEWITSYRSLPSTPPTAAQWEGLRSEIQTLYSTNTLMQTKRILEKRYGFRAT